MVGIIVFSAFSLLISVIDAKTYRIPDLLLISFLSVMIILNLDKDYAFHIYRFFSGAVCFFLFFFIFRITGGLGYGDVKYAAVLGYALGIESVCLVFLLSSGCGAVLYLVGNFALHWDKHTRLPFAPLLGLSSTLVAIGTVTGAAYELY
jgi:prepilin signal peptidase PulO-like enzyme (type II secretory pathway)